MGWQVTQPNDADASLCDGLIVFDRASADSNASDQNTFMVDYWRPPGKVIRPSLECSIPKREPPGCESWPICPVGIPKKTAVLLS